jgi:uncharacterized protein
MIVSLAIRVKFAFCIFLKQNEEVMFQRRLYIVLGFIAVGLGLLGIPTPILPTTPFLLLAAFFFARSSQRWHDWLIGHRIFGPYINAFRRKQGLTRGQKIRIALVATTTLLVTGGFSPYWQARALALFIWSTGMIALYLSRTDHQATTAPPESH